ncbi:MAG: hypothetical protein JW737_01155 [Acidobacteria bacterium]|nr:hypothetical protein [Acidobacteriota bacterium]
MTGKYIATSTVLLLISLTILFLIVCTEHDPEFISTVKYRLANKGTDSIEFTILEDDHEGVNLYRVWLFIMPEGEILGCQYEGETRTYLHSQAAGILRRNRMLPLRLEAIKTIQIYKN